jgi:hypothetical protein
MKSDVPQRPRGRTVHKDALKWRLTHPPGQKAPIRPLRPDAPDARQAFGRGGPTKLRSVNIVSVEPAFRTADAASAALERGGRAGCRASAYP